MGDLVAFLLLWLLGWWLLWRVRRLFPRKERWQPDHYHGQLTGAGPPRHILNLQVQAPNRYDPLPDMLCELVFWRRVCMAVAVATEQCYPWGRWVVLPDDFAPDLGVPLPRGFYWVRWTAPRNPGWSVTDHFYVNASGQITERKSHRIEKWWRKLRTEPTPDE